MRIVFAGASGHGKVCSEIAEINGYDDILFLDDNWKLGTYGSYPLVGAVSDYSKFIDGNTEFFVSIGNTEARSRIQEKIKNSGGNIATLVHPKSIISKGVEIGPGCVVMAGAVVNIGVVLGQGVIVNTSSSIDHDCEIGDYCHVAVGAHLCGTVKVGPGTWIGAGAVISNNMKICSGCMIGAGAVVVNHIKKAGIYVGIPAGMKGI